jgi:hypothetical protein
MIQRLPTAGLQGRTDAKLSEERAVKSTIWLSYALGVNGDYEGMYAWLDNQGAKECGSGVTYLQFTHEGDLLASLKSEIEGAVALDKRSRIYVIYKKDEKISGRYLIGHRKGAPWQGFGDKDETEEDLGDTQ